MNRQIVTGIMASLLSTSGQGAVFADWIWDMPLDPRKLVRINHQCIRSE